MHFFKTRNSGLALVFLSSFAFADEQPTKHFPFDFIKKGHLVLELGGFYATQGKEQDIDVETLVGNRYTVKSRDQGNGLAGVGYFLDGPERGRFKFSYGANVFFFGTTSTKGYIIEEHLDTNLSYTYKIQNIPLYFMGKNVVKTNSEKYDLVFDVGVGPNFIQASHYNEVPLTTYTVPDDAFKAHTGTAFSATVGAGFRFNNVVDKVPLECGYRFFYLGQGHFASDNDLVLSNLKTGNNYANAIICSVTL